MNKLVALKSEFSNLSLLKMFEIEVLNKNTNESDYIIFDISIDKNKFVAMHEPLTVAQEKSSKIAFVSIHIDSDFSLDQNLQELYEECTNAILYSEFFELI